MPRTISCQQCKGTGFNHGEECRVCNGAPRLDFARFVSIQLQIDDLRKTNLLLHRENRVLRSCVETGRIPAARQEQGELVAA